MNLGKINVICGRNNSGKSTLLEGINNPEHRYLGKEFGEREVGLLYQNSTKTTAWQGYSSQVHEEYKQLLFRTSAMKPVWFQSQEEEFASEILRVIDDSTSPLYERRPDLSGILAGFRIATRGKIETVLIPPKRAVELSRPVESSQPISPEGAGILNYLFFAKNQTPKSPARMEFDRLRALFERISSGYSFDVILRPANELALGFSSPFRPWLSADACGLGLQDLLVILYHAIRKKHNFVLIEEPESHMHPDMQRKLLSFMRDEVDDKQFFVTTHSNIFVNSAMVDHVYFTTYNGGVQVEEATSRAAVLNDLGYEVTDNLVSDVIILVEGPSDTPVIQEFLIKKGLFGEYVIKIWPLGGDIMDQVDLEVFAEKYSLIALLDQDPHSGHIRKRFAEKCKLLNIPVHRLSRYAIENYFPLRVLRQVFGSQIPLPLIEVSPQIRLQDQIGMNVKRNNRKLAELMTLADVEETDFGEFLNKVATLCRSNALTEAREANGL